MERAGVVAFVDTLAVLRDKAVWRQSGDDLTVPLRPRSFSLKSEEHLGLTA